MEIRQEAPTSERTTAVSELAIAASHPPERSETREMVQDLEGGNRLVQNFTQELTTAFALVPPVENSLRITPFEYQHPKKADSRVTAVDLQDQAVLSDPVEVTASQAKASSSTAVEKGWEISSLSTQVRTRWLDFRTWFTPYRQIFLVVTAINVTMVVAIESGHLGGWEQDFSQFVIIHVLIAIGIRNEWVLRFLYWIVIKIFRSPRIPVTFRKRVVGILYHIGV